jgi:PST family polysaccharide transporter
MYLFLLTFSNYLLYFLTIPHQTRILGPDLFGLVGFAIAFTAYFKILIDFGFMISATEQVSIHRKDSTKISSILSNVTYARLLLAGASAILLVVLCLYVPTFRENYLLFMLFFIGSAAKSLQPDFVYRGVERMRAITIRSVLAQVFFMIFLFVLVKSPADILWIPALDAIGSIVALVFIMIHIYRLGYKIKKPCSREVLATVKRGLWFFYSRIATNIYTATNIFVLGLSYGAASSVLGLYTSADRLVSAGKQAITPISDSLYPHMVSKRDFKLMKYILIGGTMLMAIGCSIVAVFAYPICAFIFGSEYYAAGEYLRILTVAVFLAFPGILLGFPALSPMGLAKQANISNIIAAGTQILQIGILAATGQLTAVNICIITCITEFVTLLYRGHIVYINRDRLSTVTLPTK